MPVIIICARPDCENSIMGHKWGKIKNPEWLFLKSGRTYCPDHWPAWAAKWREEKARVKAQAQLQTEGSDPVDPVQG